MRWSKHAKHGYASSSCPSNHRGHCIEAACADGADASRRESGLVAESTVRARNCRLVSLSNTRGHRCELRGTLWNHGSAKIQDQQYVRKRTGKPQPLRRTFSAQHAAFEFVALVRCARAGCAVYRNACSLSTSWLGRWSRDTRPLFYLPCVNHTHTRDLSVNAGKLPTFVNAR